MKKILAVLSARNKEFIRDRSALAWNLLFPFAVVIGFGFMFTGRGQDVYKVGVVGEEGVLENPDEGSFLALPHIEWVVVEPADKGEAIEKLGRHQYDLIVEPGTSPPKYWVNSESPKGTLLEPVLFGTAGGDAWEKGTVTGAEIRYVDWLLPGLLAMNMMFSCLFGVGYVLVRYRKNGVLRRLKATPLSAFEFLSAQVGSRLILVMVVTAIIYFGTFFLIHFQMLGNVLSLFIVFTLGAICLIALGLLIAARTASEEFAGGLLNLATWPMMFMSGVWFSLEGTPEWVQMASNVFPLTHVINAARAIMTEGASLADVWPQILAILGMTLVFSLIGSAMFRWE